MSKEEIKKLKLFVSNMERGVYPYSTYRQDIYKWCKLLIDYAEKESKD